MSDTDVATKAASSAREEDRPRPSSKQSFGGARAHAASWLLLALINAAVISFTLTESRGLGVRFAHHAYDLGHIVLAALLSWSLVRAWERLGISRRWVGYAVLGGLALALSLGLMGDDLAGFVQRRSVHGGKTLWYVLSCVVVATGAVSAALAGRLLARPWVRWLALAAGVFVGVLNHLVLRFNYPGVHLFVAWYAALLMGSATTTVRWPAGRFDRLGTRFRWTVVGLATVGSAASLLIPPSNSVWRELYRSSGSVFAPFLARILPANDNAGPPLAIEGSPWFRDRRNLPPIPPTGGREIVPKNAIVIFITVDALRFDVLSDGKFAQQLPAFEALRKQSVEFTTATAPSPSTVTSVISVFTGKFYTGLYWSEIPSGAFKSAIMPHGDESPRLAGLLTPAGVKTVHVIGAWGLAADVGVGNGFGEEIRSKKQHGRAAEVMGLAIDRLRKAGPEPLFMYMHFVDSHAPYDLAGTHGTEHERYIRELQLVDRQVGRLTRHLAGSGLEDRTLVILSADHGEAFGEHNTHYHAVSVYEEMVHIPLLFRLPSGEHRQVHQRVSLMDVAPTVLDVYGQPAPATFLAQSLIPLLRGEDVKLSRPVGVDAGRRMQALYFDDGTKAIVDLKRKTQEVYDLGKDPKELDNLVDADPERASRHLRALRVFFDAHACRREGYEVPWRVF